MAGEVKKQAGAVLSSRKPAEISCVLFGVWLNNPDEPGLFYVSAIDKYFGGLSDDGGNSVDATFLKRKGDRDTRFQCMHGTLIALSGGSGNRSEMSTPAEHGRTFAAVVCVHRPLFNLFGWFVVSVSDKGYHRTGRRELTAVLTECRSLISIPEFGNDGPRTRSGNW